MHVRKFQPTQEMDFATFADQHQLDLEIHWRGRNENPGRKIPEFYSHFAGAEVKGDGTLTGSFGDGNTPEESVQDYAREIAGKILVLNAGNHDRREIQVPMKLTIPEGTVW